MTKPGLTGKQGVRGIFSGNKVVSTDNRLWSEMSAFGVRSPSRRTPGMTGSCLVSESTDSRPKSESSASHWKSHGERWKRRTHVDWTMALP